MGQERSGFLHPAGALSKREKTGPSSPPARPEEPLYPSNDPREGRVPAGWKSASSHPARPGRRPRSPHDFVYDSPDFDGGDAWPGPCAAGRLPRRSIICFIGQNTFD